MNSTDQEKLFNAGFSIIYGTTAFASKTGLMIVGKTPDNHNLHVIEDGFKSKAQLKRRLKHIQEHEPMMVDLYDSKNNLRDF